MKSNALLKWLVIPAVLLVLFMVVRLLASHGAKTDGPHAVGEALTRDEMKALGVEGDTPHDTVATLVGQVKVLRTQIQTALVTNQNQQAENLRLRQRENDIDQRIQTAIGAERDKLHQDRTQADTDQQQTRSLLQALQQRLDGLGGKTGHAELPIGLGLQPGDGDGLGDGDAVTWVEPQDAPPTAGKPSTIGHANGGQTVPFPTRFGVGEDDGTASPTMEVGHDTPQSHAHPVYTVPANATLIGSVAMTALIGRVPVDGTVNDPYPFKVLIGPDNLTANGIELPDVAGAVVSGSASGDWTLSCVRGQVRSITFVFRDGTVRTLPAGSGSSGEGEAASSQTASTRNPGGNANSATQGGLGWISDPYGIPCVGGERRSNAKQYLGSQALITAAGAGAASLIPSDHGNSAFIATDGSSLGTVGISGNEAMGRILQGGVQEVSKYVNQLYGEAFAAIYVRPGAQVAVHIDQPLFIDYDAAGRKVRHGKDGIHARDLD